MQAQVALETTVMTHGLPHPRNLQIVREMSQAVSDRGATPCVIGILDGGIHTSLDDPQLERLAGASDVRKVSLRDLPIIGTTKEDGGTTVSATLFLAQRAGIPVFATGGIGGVHRGAPQDVSADLPALATIPGCVVCAGAKSILDLERTRERLETDGVPVLGWKTNEFPAFYSRESGLLVDQRVESAQEIAAIIRERDRLGLRASVLVVAPCPGEAAIPSSEMEAHLSLVQAEAEAQGIHGKELTPYLLGRIAKVTAGRSLEANRALLLNNAGIAAEVSIALQ